MLTAALCALLGTMASQQESVYESADHGIRLKIPTGWKIEASRQPQVILRLTQEGEGEVKPEIQVYLLGFPQPMTLSQYKEQLRHYLQRAYKEPRMLDDREETAGRKPGFVLEIASRGKGGSNVISHKGVFEQSPRRMVGVDGVFPAEKAEALGPFYANILKSLEFIPRKLPLGADAGLQALSAAVEKLAAGESPQAQVDSLDIFASDKKVGQYIVKIKPAERGDKKGVELEGDYRLDLEAEGKLESRVTGFLSNDLTLQSLELLEVKVGKDKRVQNFEAAATLADGRLESSRRINGEPGAARFEVPPNTIFSEFLELLQQRLLGLGKTLVAVPSLSAFDNQPTFSKIEIRGLHAMKVDGETSQIQVALLARGDGGSLVNYWYDADGRLLRIIHQGRSLILKRAQ